jgi:twitching motility two-component system response regulator PilH
MAKKILVVDDVSTDRIHLRTILEANGYTVIEADDGGTAVTVAEAQEPDLILMDVVMKVVSGFQGTRLLQKNPKTKGIPVVMVTSVNKNTDRENAKENGARAFIVKPATASSLLPVLNEIFGAPQLRAA